MSRSRWFYRFISLYTYLCCFVACLRFFVWLLICLCLYSGSPGGSPVRAAGAAGWKKDCSVDGARHQGNRRSDQATRAHGPREDPETERATGRERRSRAHRRPRGARRQGEAERSADRQATSAGSARRAQVRRASHGGLEPRGTSGLARAPARCTWCLWHARHAAAACRG